MAAERDIGFVDAPVLGGVDGARAGTLAVMAGGDAGDVELGADDHQADFPVLYASALDGWPVKVTSPGAMGPYAFVPFMECYHGVVSMDHTPAATTTPVTTSTSRVHQ